jgi:hypothetical protein
MREFLSSGSLLKEVINQRKEEPTQNKDGKIAVDKRKTIQ